MIRSAPSSAARPGGEKPDRASVAARSTRSQDDRSEGLSEQKNRAMLMSLLDRPRPGNRLGSLLGFAVAFSAAIRAYHPGILIGHLVQEGGKRLTAVIA